MSMIDSFEVYWVCPKLFCKSMLIFDEPHLPCAKHGDMIPDHKMSRLKRLTRKWL